MKKLLHLICLSTFSIYAQVGINTTNPHSSSMLDITAIDKGLLIPRISIPNLNAAAPVTSPETSLVVYNTNATSGIGFYYWNGTKWTALGAGENYWTKTGNDIYNNNTGNVGVGTITPSTKLHVEQIGTPSTLLNQTFEGNTIAPLTGGGNISWATQSVQKNNGTYAAKSGAITHNQTSVMTTTIVVPAGGANLSFYCKVNSESAMDFGGGFVIPGDPLIFYIDGVEQNRWTGSSDWTRQSYTLPAGSRTLRWEYVKDDSGSTGADAAYIDDIKIDVFAPPILKIVDGNQALGKVLVSDNNGNATWQNLSTNSITNLPEFITVIGMQIPTCDTVIVGSTGAFTVPIRGVNTTVNWEILQQQTSVGASTTILGETVLRSPAMPERLQVRYDFSPPLPFVPNGFIFSGNNDSSSYPDNFSVNYTTKSQSSITVNIVRTDAIGVQTNPCWTYQSYFDVLITK